MPDARAIIRQVPMFAALSDDDCDAVLRVLKARKGRPGDTLFREGDPGDTLLVVVEGSLEATVTTAGGAQASLSVIAPGHVVGELAFLDAAPRAATVSTKSGATVLEFSRRALLLLCRDQPRIAAVLQRTVLTDLTRRLRATEGAPAAAPKSATPASRAGRPVTAAQLRAFPVLASHSSEDLELLAYMGTVRGFAKGDALMREGAEGDAAFLLLGGSVEVTRASESGPVATLAPGALVGQLALLDHARRSATVTATSDTTALELKASVFGNLVNASSPLALAFQREVARAAARHLRSASARFAANAGPRAKTEEAPTHNEIEGDWSIGDDAAIDLAIDLEAARR
jgi:CRP/FNR family cyclic AMP-dependent transcriptional regulator